MPCVGPHALTVQSFIVSWMCSVLVAYTMYTVYMLCPEWAKLRLYEWRRERIGGGDERKSGLVVLDLLQRFDGNRSSDGWLSKYFIYQKNAINFSLPCLVRFSIDLTIAESPKVIRAIFGLRCLRCSCCFSVVCQPPTRTRSHNILLELLQIGELKCE